MNELFRVLGIFAPRRVQNGHGLDPSHLYFRSNDPRAHVDDDQVIRPLPTINKCQHPILDPKKAIRSKLVSVLFACDHRFVDSALDIFRRINGYPDIHSILKSLSLMKPVLHG